MADLEHAERVRAVVRSKRERFPSLAAGREGYEGCVARVDRTMSGEISCDHLVTVDMGEEIDGDSVLRCGDCGCKV